MIIDSKQSDGLLPTNRLRQEDRFIVFFIYVEGESKFLSYADTIITFQGVKI